MKTLLLNDTSWYHAGCKEVVDALNRYYEPDAVCDNRDTIDIATIESFDLVVLNGEGTLHHNAPWAQKFLGYLREAQRMGKETHIVNTVWQEMGNGWDDVLHKSSVVEVREVLSKNEMYNISGIDSKIVLDVSLHNTVDYENISSEDVCVGGSFFGDILVEWDVYTKVDIFTMSWSTLVNTLRSAKLLITGRHHEMCAALQARTPVIVLSGNTWKNEGFFHTMGCKELLLPPSKKNINATIDGMYNSSWNELWDRLGAYEYKYGTK